MTTLTRRQLTKLGLATGIFAAFRPSTLLADGQLPAPDFTLDEYPRYVAGLRPYRNGTFRLEREPHGDRLLVHNYGHGGAGITMSWGVAHEVRDIVRDWTQSGGQTSLSVAVLGAGVIGLTAATLLVESGYHVTVYAKGFLEETTSHIAGGQFAPSTVAFTDDAVGNERFKRILRRSFRTHESKIGLGYGVSRRPNYALNRSRSFGYIPLDVVPEPEYFPQLPFPEHQNRSGYCYQTLLIEPPIFLRRLELELRLAGVRMIRTTFVSQDEVLSTLSEDVVVNCLGLGAGSVMADTAVVPVRGQLVLLKPQTHLQYLYVGGGYIFPRSDCVVVGGSYERGVADPTPDPQMCAEILAQARAQFSPELEQLSPTPDWMKEI